MRYSVLRPSAQRAITSVAISAAAGTAAAVAAVRQAIATVAAISTANVVSATGSCRVASTSRPATTR